MKKNTLLALLISIFLCACAGGGKDHTFTLTGRITDDNFEGRIVYLKDAVKGTGLYDSAQIVHGKFTFIGQQDTAIVRELYVQENDSDNYPLTLPVVLEEGEIVVTLGNIVSVGNTPLNNGMMQFLLAKDKFMDKDFQGKDVIAIRKEFSDFLVTWIIKNADNPIGKYIYAAYNNKLDDEQKGKVCKTAGW